MTDGILHDTIVVVSKPGCVQCNAVYRRLDEAGVDYVVVDASEDDYWRDKLVENNIQRVPVTIKGDTWIKGYDPDALDRLF